MCDSQIDASSGASSATGTSTARLLSTAAVAPPLRNKRTLAIFDESTGENLNRTLFWNRPGSKPYLPKDSHVSPRAAAMHPSIMRAEIKSCAVKRKSSPLGFRNDLWNIFPPAARNILATRVKSQDIWITGFLGQAASILQKHDCSRICQPQTI